MPIILDQIAQRYGKLPSELLELTQEKMQINFTCAEMGALFEKQEQAKEAAKNKRESARNRGRR